MRGTSGPFGSSNPLIFPTMNFKIYSSYAKQPRDQHRLNDKPHTFRLWDSRNRKGPSNRKKISLWNPFDSTNLFAAFFRLDSSPNLGQTGSRADIRSIDSGSELNPIEISIRGCCCARDRWIVLYLQLGEGERKIKLESIFIHFSQRNTFILYDV